MKNIIILLFSLLALSVSAQTSDKEPHRSFQYRIYLTDKQGTPYSLSHPEKFLSQRSLERRARQGLKVDSTDLPVSPAYVDSIKKLGFRVLGTSRWQNTVWVESSVDLPLNEVNRIAESCSFISHVKRIYASTDSVEIPGRQLVSWQTRPDTLAHGNYGDGFKQINMLNGTELHKAGYRGKGKMIAILDAGFHNADSIGVFDNINIVATRDFAPRRSQLFAEHHHGTMVLSTMAMNRPDTMIGTAPDASYVLIRTEDTDKETCAEEDSWTMGAEFADSIGADLINSSLGYTHWDGDTAEIRYRDLDGQTWFISRTASMLASKGIILCNSAGNEGDNTWHKINVPADARDILTVGAVTFDGVNTTFSSLGPSQDGRVKPDVAAPGDYVYVVNGRGKIVQASGTSFASPILCGMVACLWQKYPQKTAKEIIEMVRRSGDRYEIPDNVYGFGVPGFSR